MSADSVFQRVPPLGFEFELLSISRDEHSAEGFLCDVAYLLDAFHLFDFGMVADRYGEEQLVVLTSIHLHCHATAYLLLKTANLLAAVIKLTA